MKVTEQISEVIRDERVYASLHLFINHIACSLLYLL
jgi:hypothetical protein